MQSSVIASDVIIDTCVCCYCDFRSCQSEFTTVLLRWSLVFASHEAYPQWRCIAWSWDASMLAVASSSGLVDIYDAVLGTTLCSIPSVRFCGSEI